MSEFNYTNLSPFKWFVLENFPFIEADFDALTNWQLFCKLGKEINKIIDSQNIVGEQAEALTTAFNNLQNYVDNYFENLDIQEEINEKLDDMVEQGTLQNLINSKLFAQLNSDILTNTNKINNVENKLDNNIEEINNKLSNNTNAIEEVDTKVNSIMNNNPIPVDSISQMTDITKIYVLTTDGNWYYYNGSSWISGGIYQSTQIANDSIIMEKMINSLQSENQFNYDTITNGKTLDNTGNLIDNTNYYTGDYIPVKANQTYYVNYCRIVAYYDTSKEYVSRDDLPNFPILYSFTPAQDGYVRTTHNTNTNGLIFVSTLDNKKDNYSIKGYIDNTENLKFLNKLKNLINYNNVQIFKVASLDTGEITDSAYYATIDIPIPTPSTIYYNYLRSGIYLGKNKEYIGQLNAQYVTELTEKSISNIQISYIRCNIKISDLPKAYLSYLNTTNSDNLLYGKYLPNDIKITKENIIDKFFNKTLYAFGDSILAGHLSNISCIDTFCTEKKMNYIKYALNGATIVNGAQGIINQINNASSNIPDYVLFNGLTNDAYTSTVVGTITENIDSELDLTTFCGCFENICRTLINKYYSAKICYIAVHKMPTRNKDVQFNLQDLAHQICNKYSIPVIDIFNNGNLNTYIETMRSLYTYDTLDNSNIIAGGSGGNGTHPNTLGYKLFYNNMIENML